MMTREKIKQTIQTVRELDGFLSFNFVPSKSIYDLDYLHGLYHGGQKIDISRDEVRYPDRRWVIFNDTNFEEIVDDVWNYIKDDITGAIHTSFENLDWEFEELKYFDRPENADKLKLFQEEVLKNKHHYV